MHSHLIRELAKVGTGLVIADLASVIWFGAAGFFPLTILGVTWDASAILPIVVFDLAIIILLAHFGWNIKLPVSSPSERTLLTIAGLIFVLVALLHFMRLALGWSLIVADFEIPLWLSWFGFLVALYLAYSSIHFARRR